MQFHKKARLYKCTQQLQSSPSFPQSFDHIGHLEIDVCVNVHIPSMCCKVYKSSPNTFICEAIGVVNLNRKPSILQLAWDFIKNQHILHKCFALANFILCAYKIDVKRWKIWKERHNLSQQWNGITFLRLFNPLYSLHTHE